MAHLLTNRRIIRVVPHVIFLAFLIFVFLFLSIFIIHLYTHVWASPILIQLLTDPLIGV